MKVCIIGAGAFGTALAAQISKNGHEVLLWSFEEHVAQEINELHRNNQFLPDIELPEPVRSSGDLEEVIGFGEVLINATPVFATRPTYQGKNLQGKPLFSASKGVERGTHQLLHEIFEQILAGDFSYGAISGPSFAVEVGRGQDTALTIASNYQEELKKVKGLFETESFKIQVSDDVIGVELSGALKNVLAIAAGLASGAGLGKNYQAAIFVQGLNEMIALGEKMGAKKETFYSLAGLGDLFLTSTSDQSRNFSFGYSLGRGESVEKASEGKTVEGMGSAESAYFLAKKFDLAAPLFENIYDSVTEKKNAKEALADIWSTLTF